MDSLHFVPQFLALESADRRLSAEVCAALAVDVVKDEADAATVTVKHDTHGEKTLPRKQLQSIATDEIAPDSLLETAAAVALATFKHDRADLVGEITVAELARVKSGLIAGRQFYFAGCRHRDTSLSPVKPRPSGAKRPASRPASPTSLTPPALRPALAPTDFTGSAPGSHRQRQDTLPAGGVSQALDPKSLVRTVSDLE